MLPVSGAAQLKYSDAPNTRPISSASGAYSRLESPGDQGAYSCGRNRFQRPAFFASALMRSVPGQSFQRLAGSP